MVLFFHFRKRQITLSERIIYPLQYKIQALSHPNMIKKRIVNNHDSQLIVKLSLIIVHVDSREHKQYWLTIRFNENKINFCIQIFLPRQPEYITEA